MRGFFILFCLLVATGTACHDNPPPNYPPEPKIDFSKLVLGNGDKLTLTAYYGSKSISASYTLDNSGKIAVQYIGEVDANGKTLADLRKEIQDKLADGYLIDPIVQLKLDEINSLTVSVSGMVAKTGSLKFTPNMTIVDVIAQSGGFTPLARKNMVKVIRTVDDHKETYKLPVEMMSDGERPSFKMAPGDEVYVPERPW